MPTVRIITALAVLLALAGVASAQSPCPECDEDGEGDPDNTYRSVDVGVLGEDHEVLADTDAAYGHEGDERGFWTWMSICLSAFLEHVERVVGVETDVDANVEVYASENGVDVDASTRGLQTACDKTGLDVACDQRFDDTDVGHLDGMTWETMSEVESTTGVDAHVPGAFLPPDAGEGDIDVCVDANVELGVCG